MIAAPIYVTFVICGEGKHACTTDSFPWISYSMGIYSYDKVYTFLFTFYSCVMFTTYRGAFNRFLDKIPTWLNYSLLICGMGAVISGPLLACFDEVVDPSTFPDYQIR